MGKVPTLNTPLLDSIISGERYRSPDGVRVEVTIKDTDFKRDMTGKGSVHILETKLPWRGRPRVLKDAKKFYAKYPGKQLSKFLKDTGKKGRMYTLSVGVSKKISMRSKREDQAFVNNINLTHFAAAIIAMEELGEKVVERYKMYVEEGRTESGYRDMYGGSVATGDLRDSLGFQVKFTGFQGRKTDTSIYLSFVSSCPYFDHVEFGYGPAVGQGKPRPSIERIADWVMHKEKLKADLYRDVAEELRRRGTTDLFGDDFNRLLAKKMYAIRKRIMEHGHPGRYYLQNAFYDIIVANDGLKKAIDYNTKALWTKGILRKFKYKYTGDEETWHIKPKPFRARTTESIVRKVQDMANKVDKRNQDRMARIGVSAIPRSKKARGPGPRQPLSAMSQEQLESEIEKRAERTGLSKRLWTSVVAYHKERKAGSTQFEGQGREDVYIPLSERAQEQRKMQKEQSGVGKSVKDRERRTKSAYGYKEVRSRNVVKEWMPGRGGKKKKVKDE